MKSHGVCSRPRLQRALKKLHCLPSSSCAAKPESHPSGDGVRPHLPASEFVCVDELWTQSAGRLSGGDSSHSKHFTLLNPPNNRPQGSKPACHCGPVKPKGPDANTRDSELGKIKLASWNSSALL